MFFPVQELLVVRYFLPCTHTTLPCYLSQEPKNAFLYIPCTFSHEGCWRRVFPFLSRRRAFVNFLLGFFVATTAQQSTPDRRRRERRRWISSNFHVGGGGEPYVRRQSLKEKGRGRRVSYFGCGIEGGKGKTQNSPVLSFLFLLHPSGVPNKHNNNPSSPPSEMSFPTYFCTDILVFLPLPLCGIDQSRHQSFFFRIFDRTKKRK